MVKVLFGRPYNDILCLINMKGESISVLVGTISLQAVFVYRCSVLLMFACLVKTTLLQVLFCGT